MFDGEGIALFGLLIFRKSSVEILLPVFFRCQSGLFLKGLYEMALRRKREELGDAQAGMVGMLEHVLGCFDLLDTDEVADGYAGLLFEKLGKIRII